MSVPYEYNHKVYYLQTDDKLALREIALQLKLDNVVSGTERVFGSFAQVSLLYILPPPVVGTIARAFLSTKLGSCYFSALIIPFGVSQVRRSTHFSSYCIHPGSF